MKIENRFYFSLCLCCCYCSRCSWCWSDAVHIASKHYTNMRRNRYLADNRSIHTHINTQLRRKQCAICRRTQPYDIVPCTAGRRAMHGGPAEMKLSCFGLVNNDIIICDIIFSGRLPSGLAQCRYGLFGGTREYSSFACMLCSCFDSGFEVFGFLVKDVRGLGVKWELVMANSTSFIDLVYELSMDLGLPILFGHEFLSFSSSLFLSLSTSLPPYHFRSLLIHFLHSNA